MSEHALFQGGRALFLGEEIDGPFSCYYRPTAATAALYDFRSPARGGGGGGCDSQMMPTVHRPCVFIFHFYI